MIEAVGAAAAEPPRLLDLVWGRADAPKVTLVGKGVCFDTGGLDIKPASSMGLMKKDMGGAATAMGLADMVMGLGLDLRLRLLVPAVENAISGAAMRPGDILPSRKGLTVEVNNTDAEGRLVLADALALADEEAPELIVSLATLTGAARVALGPDVPPFFTDDEALAAELAAASVAVADPLWRLPFWEPYEPLIEPGIADLDNAPVRRDGRRDHRGAVPAPLRHRRAELSARRHLRLDAGRRSRRGRRAALPGGARDLRRARGALPMSPAFASRLLPARPDLAAEQLRGQVEAARYAPGAARRVAVPLLDLTRRGRRGRRAGDAAACFGETFTVYEERPDGLAWGQAALDGYVGYVRADGLGPATGHRVRVTAPWSQVYERPQVRARTLGELPCLAEVAVAGTTGGFARLRGGGFVPRAHLAPVGDWVALAERFVGAPYLWGGRSLRGHRLLGAGSGRAARRPGRRRRATRTCRRRCSASALPARGRAPARRPGVLEGACRDHARRRDAAACQRPPHGGGVRAAGAAPRRASPPRGGGPVLLRRRP